MSDQSSADVLPDLSEEAQEAVARGWIQGLADADRLADLDGQALMGVAQKLESVGRLVDAGRMFVAGAMADRSRKELGGSGLALSQGAKDPVELIARTTGASPAEARKRLLRSVPLQGARNAFTGETGPVAFPLLRAAVTAGLMSADMSAVVTTPLAPLLERGGGQEQAWMRARMYKVEMELAILAIGTQAVVEHTEVFDRAGMSAGLAAGIPAAENTGGKNSGSAADISTSARMLAVAREVGAGRLPADHVRVRRAANAHKNALLSHLVQVSSSEGERRRVEREQREEQRFVSLSQRGDGLWDLRGVLMEDTAAQLMLLRDAVLNPKRRSGEQRTLCVDEDGKPAGLVDSRNGGQRFHDALTEVLTTTAASLKAGTLHGGNPTLVITCSADQLEEEAGLAFLQGTHGEATSVVDASMARHAGCAGTIHRLLTTREGTPLSMATLGRVFTVAQREAIALRDGGCCWPGCEVPSSWVEIHHVQEWAKGGKTTVDNGVSVCFRHHRDLEALGWAVEMRGGVPWFRPPASVDHDRRWIRGQQSAHMLFDQVRHRHAQCDGQPDVEGRSLPVAGAFAVGADGGGAPAVGANVDGGRASVRGNISACGPEPELDRRSVPRCRCSGDTAEWGSFPESDGTSLPSVRRSELDGIGRPGFRRSESDGRSRPSVRRSELDGRSSPEIGSGPSEVRVPMALFELAT